MTIPPQPEPQIQDRTLKSLFGDEAYKIVPRLLPGSELIEESNIELDRSTLRADLVYNILYRGQRHLLSLELQTGADHKMPLRLLQYHTGLHARSGLPVISMVLYPFETTVPVPPYLEKSGDEVVLMLHYRVLAVWKWQAREFVRDHVVSLYPLLPAMQGANARLLMQALSEMEGHFPPERLRRHLTRFYHILERSTMISDEEKRQVTEVLEMTYGRDWFIETLPEVADLVAKGRAEGEIKGRAEGEIKGRAEGEIKGHVEEARQMLIEAVQTCHPGLLAQAQELVAGMNDAAAMRRLALEIIRATDDATAERLLIGYGGE